MSAVALYRIYDLPWSSEADQNQAFRRILLICAGTLLFLGLVTPLLPVADRSVAEYQEVPERLARLVLERQMPPPPPPPVVQPEPEPAPIPEPEPVVEQRVVEPEPEPVPVPVPEPAPVPEPVVQPEPVPPPPVDRTEQARERARGAGLMPFADELASLRDTDTAQRLSETGTSGSQDSALTAPERALITSRAGGASGGINTAEFSRDTAGGGLTDRAVTQVESPVAGMAAAQGAAAGGVQRSGESTRGSRSREEIEQVFDRNKSAIYALYNRALRQDPSLEGKVVLRLTIAPSGEVTECEIVSSELGDPELEQRLVQRVMLFQFEARDVEPITTTKPIDFFPA